MSEKEYRVYVDAMTKVSVIAQYVVIASNEEEAIEKAEAGDYEDLQIVTPRDAVLWNEIDLEEEDFTTATVQSSESEQLSLFDDDEDEDEDWSLDDFDGTVDWY